MQKLDGSLCPMAESDEVCRHVWVHHIDKDRADPLIREEMSKPLKEKIWNCISVLRSRHVRKVNIE